MDGLEGVVNKKVHRKSQAGRKADKKSKKNEHVQELTAKQRNPKAFTFQSVSKGERKFRRKEDIQSKKHHVPKVDRTPLEPPPIVVAVVGPPQVGKSTLIRCLIKSFTKTPLSVIKGPVTLIVGKKRRITFIECNNDINSMIDISKVADLVLLLIDASFGFEMEIFEFLNICQVHGMPKVMGVLTHLDMLKNNKTLKNTKKTLKHRFWTEVYAGAKLFYLSGILHGEYMKNEVKNLGRFIAVMKFRPLVWQTTHSYLLADRIEDITSEENIRQNPKCDRRVSIYGYVRGIPLNKTSSVHIPGCGDNKIEDICFLPDPCPLPEQLKKRSLVEKERLIYAPFSGVGGIVYDKDAVYVELAGSHSYNKSSHSNNELMSNLMDAKDTIETKLEQSEMLLFSNTEPIKSGDFNTDVDMAEDDEISQSSSDEAGEEKEGECETGGEEEEESDSESEEEIDKQPRSKSSISKQVKQKYKEEIVTGEDGRKRRKVVFDDDLVDTIECDEDSEEGDDEEGDVDEEEEYDVQSKQNENCDKGTIVPQPKLSEKDIQLRNKISNALAGLSENKTPVHQPDETFSDSAISSDDESDDEDGMDGDLEVSSSMQASQSDTSSSNSDDNDEDDTALNWKSNLGQKAADAFLERQANIQNLAKYVYGNKENFSEDNNDEQEADDELGGLFKVVNLKQRQQLREKDIMNGEDSSKFILSGTRDWSQSQLRDSIKDCFVTGTWKQDEDASELLKLDDMEEDEELFGDFEDLETGEKHKGQGTKEGEEKPKSQKELLEKKRKLKEQFDAEYDDKEGGGNTYYDDLKTQATKQAELNRQQFEGMEDALRVELEGFRAGLYIRLELTNIPCELVTNFDPTYPLIVGGLQPGEENIGYIRARIKKHRWYGKILKSGNPVIMSVGWRRFQTLPIYSKQEDNMRYRMLKYTPQHVACMTHFWGPITKSGTGFLAIQDVAKREPGFRIIATGTILDANQTPEVTKKLKLTGVPMKIYKKTAFIKDMFNSQLEVAKFEGGKIRTVSGIRGQIKKALNKPAGAFRATFEDKIQLSDIVFCRTWYRMDIPKLYNPVTSLLLPVEEKGTWTGMKTVGQLKREKGLRNDPNFDSLYTEIKRVPKILRKMKIPKALQKELPYHMKPKHKTKVAKEKRVAVVLNQKEEKVNALMRMLRTNYAEKHSKDRQAMKQRMAALKQRVQQEEKAKLDRQKVMKKDIFRTLSKMEKKEQGKAR